jgi:hypothetical protein
MSIKYGGYVFSKAKLYRVSPIVEDKAIAGKLVWVNKLVQQGGCDWLRVFLAYGEHTGDTYLVKPYYVIPA